jgi:hypothetical protein
MTNDNSSILISSLTSIIDDVLDYIKQKNIYEANLAITRAINDYYRTDWLGRSNQINEINKQIDTLKLHRDIIINKISFSFNANNINITHTDNLINNVGELINKKIESLRRKKAALQRLSD